MKIGVPKEVAENEFRVGLTPSSIKELLKCGHEVFIEKDAGIVCGYTNEQYEQVGAIVCQTADEVYVNAKMIVKIQCPQPAEYEFLQKKQIIFSHFDCDTELELTKVLLDKKITLISYDEIETANKKFPVIAPYNEIAGKVAVQLGANYLHKYPEIPVSRGILLGGISGVYPAKVCILGAGEIGLNAAFIAAGAGASVVVLDYDVNKLRSLEKTVYGRVQTLFANEDNVSKSVREADLLISTAKKMPCNENYVVTEEMVKSMRTGSVIVDTQSEPFSAVETMERNIGAPFIIKHSIIHCNSSNLVGLVPRTSTIAFNNALLTYLFDIANNQSLTEALKSIFELRKGVVTHDGELTNEKAAKNFEIKFTELSLLVGL